MKPSLFILIFTLLCLDISAQTLRVVMVTDVEDPQIGMLRLKDEARMLHIFDTVKWGIGYKLQVIYLNKANFRGEVVKKTLDTLQTQPNDILYLYYSGPGYYPANSKSEFPFLQLKDFQKKPLSLDEIDNLLKAKGTKLSIAMADCGINFPSRGVLSVTVSEDIRKSILQKLFLAPCGAMKIASARKGELISANDSRENSAFMFAFYEAFETMLASRTLENVCLDSLLQNTQRIVEMELEDVVLKDQLPHAIWTMTNCDAPSKRQMMTQSSRQNVLSSRDLGKQFSELVSTKDKTARQRLISQINKNFQKNAGVVVTRQSPRPSSNANSQKRQLTIENYLEGLTEYNPKLVRVELNTQSIKRASNSPQITSLSIAEIWDEF